MRWALIDKDVTPSYLSAGFKPLEASKRSRIHLKGGGALAAIGGSGCGRSPDKGPHSLRDRRLGLCAAS